MGLFAKDVRQDASADALRTERDRLDGLTMEALAGEILTRVFGPGTGNERHRVPIRDIYAVYDPSGTGSFPGLELQVVLSVQFLIEEGLQHLTHAGVLVQGGFRSDTSPTEFHLSRVGRIRVGA